MSDTGNGKTRMDQARAKVQEKAKSMFSDGKTQISESLESLAQAFRHTGNQLKEQNYGSVADYADQTAERIEKISGYLRNKNVEEILNEAEVLTRRQPVLTLAGAFTAGFIMARMFKGSRRAVS